MELRLSPEKYRELSLVVKDLLLQAKQRRASAVEQWSRDVAQCLRGDVNRGQLFQTDVTEVETDPAFFTTHYPIAEPRRDAIVAQVSTIIGKQDPIMVAVDGDMEVRTKMEQFIQNVFRGANFPSSVSKGADTCVASNTAVFCVSPADEEAMFSYGQGSEAQSGAGFYIGMIQLADLVSWGEDISGIENALMIGHRYTMDRKVAEQYAKDGTFKCAVMDVGREASSIQMDQEDYAGVQYGDVMSMIGKETALTGQSGAPITMWCLYIRSKIKLDKGQNVRWIKCTVGDSGCLYRVETHGASRHPYFPAAFLESPLGELYPERSIGRMLYELQSIVDQAFTIFWQGAVMSATPYLTGTVLDSEDKDIRPEPGEIIEGVNVQALNNMAFKPDALMGVIQMAQTAADQIGRVSQNNLGTSNTGAGTATENSIIASSVQILLEDMLRRFTANFPAMVNYICEVAALDYERFAEMYPNMPTAEELMDVSLKWQVNGMSANQTPLAKKQALQEILATMKMLDPESMMRVNSYELFRQVILNGPYASMVDQIAPEPDDTELMAQQEAMNANIGGGDGTVPQGMGLGGDGDIQALLGGTVDTGAEPLGDFGAVLPGESPI